ncbi:beta-defensin 108B [Acomys russatus]|uniref:beta-defensin 108B n=1 Tax=Acomys russatus TaxID=60746 RepID=UPI0021E1E437|nr:beta-defensin 108B [Acomys russatus]
MKIAALGFTALFMSQVLPVRGNLKEVCEHPNGACRSSCIETEVYVGRCLNKRHCCLPMGNEPRLEIGPKNSSLSLGPSMIYYGSSEMPLEKVYGATGSG